MLFPILRSKALSLSRLTSCLSSIVSMQAKQAPRMTNPSLMTEQRHKAAYPNLDGICADGTKRVSVYAGGIVFLLHEQNPYDRSS